MVPSRFLLSGRSVNSHGLPSPNSMRYAFFSYAAISVVMSVATFAAYGIDKRRAQSNRQRIPEESLHRLALCGGWPGALAGQRLFRHKTQKRPFIWRLRFIILLHVAMLMLLAYFSWR